MAKAKWEEEAKDRFLQFLLVERGERWTTRDEDVVVETATNLNFDYEIAAGDRLIALEIFRLVSDGNEIAQNTAWVDIVHSLERELCRRFIKGFRVTTPARINVPRARRDSYVAELAGRIETALAANPTLTEIKIRPVSLRKIEGSQIILSVTIGSGGTFDPDGLALAALNKNLPRKNEQLHIEGHERIIAIINWANLRTENVIEACRQIDFDRLSDIDRIFFEVEPGEFKLVFDRAVR